MTEAKIVFGIHVNEWYLYDTDVVDTIHVFSDTFGELQLNKQLLFVTQQKQSSEIATLHH